MVTSGIKRMQYQFFNAVCESLAANPELTEKLAREKFKLGIGECNDNCLLPFLRKLGIETFILLSNTPLQASRYQHLGISLSPSYVPAVDEAFPSGDALSFWERAWNLYVVYYEKVNYYPMFYELTVSENIFIKLPLLPVANNSGPSPGIIRSRSRG